MSFRFCPHCGAELPLPRTAPLSGSPPPTTAGAVGSPIYEQTSYWQALRGRVGDHVSLPATSTLVADLVRRLPSNPAFPLASIVHMLLDRSVTPRGGALLQSVRSDGRLGPAGEPAQLEQLGYVLQDGRVRRVDDVPVGSAYAALEYWGGARQHQRWHLAEPVMLDPSRHGDPYFMDEGFIAFGARWRDLGRFEEAMAALIETLRMGVEGISVGNPLVLDCHWQGTRSAQE